MRKIIARSRCSSFDSVCSNISNASVADEYEIIDKDYEELKKELKEQYNNLEKMQQDLEKRQKELEKKQYKLEKRQNILNAKFNKSIKKENVQEENVEGEVKELMRCMLNEVERKIDREELEAIGWTHSGRLKCVIS